MSNVSIPRPPDVVTVLWERNPLDPLSPRTIVDASVIGSASPCTSLLVNGRLFSRSQNCLLSNGFQRISSQRLGVFGVSVFVRQQ